MSRKSVAFAKPAEPAFLKRIKAQVGYSEGPTVNTKREQLDPVAARDLEDGDDELPTVVVLKPGDLTADQADEHRRRIEQEESEQPADLSAPVVFKSTKKKSSEAPSETEPRKKRSKKAEKTKKSLLSFDDEENDD